MESIVMTSAKTKQLEAQAEIINLLNELNAQKAAHRFSAFIFSAMEVPEVLSVMQGSKMPTFFYFLNEILQLAGQTNDKESQERIFDDLANLRSQGAAYQFSNFMFHIFSIDEVLDGIEPKTIAHTNMINKILQLTDEL